ncbi:uncharacterized protein A1O5_01044 [Cladophialophora psammophila CBS 110553]|uniref:Uncharacterized protein n=1 Tax=Cladophialophora psammophila CBS 110553 TaxID=1182543 RepID=W9XHW2_9EURO|nr:uncharacterized protein A1O5_01044 [Cladophialophora psammophila CBS 110553]EXJ76536.1 hypothetical protein A1O5_01044 [Cladophialophora psammophila CBS 110553]
MTAFFNVPSGPQPRLNPERNLTERTAYVLFAYRTFPTVSSNRMRQDTKGNIVDDVASWGSLEDIHNSNHNLTGSLGGSGGYMANAPMSAFDRLSAIWQKRSSRENPAKTPGLCKERLAGGSSAVRNQGDGKR